MVNPNMEGNATIFNNAAVLVSAGAAVVSAFFAGLAFLFSRKLSTREMIDILKAEILVIFTSQQKQLEVIQAVKSSYQGDGGATVDVKDLARFLRNPNHRRGKWLILFPAAFEELKHEGYKKLNFIALE